MAPSFLVNPPQPGDGAWLLQSASKRRGFGRKKLPMLLHEGQEVSNHDVDPASAPHETFLQSFGKARTSSDLRHDTWTPRTIADAKLLSPTGARISPGLTSDLAPSTHTPEHNYTVADSESTADTMASATTKALPPHLRAKKLPPHLRAKKKVDDPAAQPAADVISDKLSELGAKVSTPQPAAASVAITSATETSKDRPQVNGVSTSSNRGSGDGLPKTRPIRPSKWLKGSEIPKPDPERWNIKWEPEKQEYCSSDDSLRADSGFGANKKKRPVNGESTKLTDWDGNWAPAPIDWDARPAFRDSQTVLQIEQWMQGIEEDLCGITRKIDVEIEAQDAAPRYWIPIVIGKQAPQTFWNDLVKSNAPEPLDEDDLVSAKPWWEQYTSPESNYLKPYDHPSLFGIDPDEETAAERVARENDHGSIHHAANRRRTEIAKRDAKRERRRKVEERARKTETLPAIPRDRIKPGLNLYIRSAKPADIKQITEIYNHYIRNGACTPETSERLVSDMLARYREIIRNKLPFLVACERGIKVPARRKKRDVDEDIILPDRIVGFTFADDYNDMQGMYRFTAEVEVYTHNEHFMKGVAKCLLDKLMAMLNPEYVERGGFDVQGEELEGVGPSRIITNIIVNLPYEKPERLEWIGRWLCGWLRFEQVGDIKGIGVKGGKK